MSIYADLEIFSGGSLRKNRIHWQEIRFKMNELYDEWRRQNSGKLYGVFLATNRKTVWILHFSFCFMNIFHKVTWRLKYFEVSKSLINFSL